MISWSSCRSPPRLTASIIRFSVAIKGRYSRTAASTTFSFTRSPAVTLRIRRRTASAQRKPSGSEMRRLAESSSVRSSHWVEAVMGLDPGYRNGCKVAVVDGTGRVLDTAVVYPTFGERQKNEAIAALAKLIRKHGVEHIAIGNGTASRETEQMAVELIRQVGADGAQVSYMIVSEAGASVYSASQLAADEFPQYDVNLRSAVSIARRLQDPLAELVKIDPKAIGVGQYQHDMGILLYR